MKNILLATDLAANSDRAMERALKLAKENCAKLHIVHVLPGYKEKKLTSSLKEDTEDLIKGYVYDYKDSQGLSITITALQGDEAYAEILGYAKKIKADLIVMGMHGKTKIRDLFVGTTLERVVRKGIWPVLMVKNKPTGGPYQSIMASVDFDPGSRAALRMAMEIAPKAVFSVVHAYNIPVYVGETSYLYIESIAAMEEEQQKILDAFLKTETTHFKKEHNGATSRLSCKLVGGPTYDTLVKQAKNAKADVIALGAHGRIGVMPGKLGGTAQDILANPPCDVLVARDR
jgi:nucleotide-binding universal stress UspA family protein